ncbi:NUDIX domain-containing protein [Croceicoccus sp. F390]|uniref:NUDIX domain-containing protein n=1 Tax=Croceicoccus esteveae TaxID=3075597 RepID=A0ABU2ZE00_9SPHN|nr:NUDIX domain-containing protein [Croceicoccus sp. F390]MDT0574828.1 NUDIX domain-containing protein [Croceicoccus sp. F390]
MPAGYLPAPLHRAALRLAHGLRKYWWRIARPTIEGVCILAFNDRGELLLVRHSYQRKGIWCLPSGGISSNNGVASIPSIMHHATRELAEEAGLATCRSRLVTTHETCLHGATNRVHLVEIGTSGDPQPDRREIDEAQFFALTSLPEPLDPTTDRMLALWRQGSEDLALATGK